MPGAALQRLAAALFTATADRAGLRITPLLWRARFAVAPLARGQGCAVPQALALPARGTHSGRAFWRLPPLPRLQHTHDNSCGISMAAYRFCLRHTSAWQRLY